MFMEKRFLVLGFLGVILTDGSPIQSGNVETETVDCSGTHCRLPVAIPPTPNPEVTSEESCPKDTSGWGLRGTDRGCCGDYTGCCTYASYLCYIQDAMCRCCTLADRVCGTTCIPEVGCVAETGSDVTDTLVADADEIDEKGNADIINDSVLSEQKDASTDKPDPNDLVNEAGESVVLTPDTTEANAEAMNDVMEETGSGEIEDEVKVEISQTVAMFGDSQGLVIDDDGSGEMDLNTEHLIPMGDWFENKEK